MTATRTLYATFTLMQISLLAPCSNPGSPANGTMRASNFRHNSWVTFSCDRHHQRDGKERIKCIDGSWSGSVPVCIGEKTRFYLSCTYKIISEVQSHGDKSQFMKTFAAVEGRWRGLCQNWWSIPWIDFLVLLLFSWTKRIEPAGNIILPNVNTLFPFLSTLTQLLVFCL